MLFIGYLFGIRSERQLEKEIQTNIAYRWFLGLSLTERVPDHTTISWNRGTRFKDTTIFQDIFDEVVHLAMNHLMVARRVLITDSTHLKANANKRKFTKQVIEKSTRNYITQLDEDVKQDRDLNGKKN